MKSIATIMVMFSMCFASQAQFTNVIYDYTKQRNTAASASYMVGDTGRITATFLPQNGGGFRASTIGGRFFIVPNVGTAAPNLTAASFVAAGYSGLNVFGVHRTTPDLFRTGYSFGNPKLQVKLIGASSIEIEGISVSGFEYDITWDLNDPATIVSGKEPVVALFAAFNPGVPVSDQFKLYWIGSDQQIRDTEAAGLYNEIGLIVQTTEIESTFKVPMLKIVGGFVTPRLNPPEKIGSDWRLTWLNTKTKYAVQYSTDLQFWSLSPFSSGVNRLEVRTTIPGFYLNSDVVYFRLIPAP